MRKYLFTKSILLSTSGEVNFTCNDPQAESGLYVPEDIARSLHLAVVNMLPRWEDMLKHLEQAAKDGVSQDNIMSYVRQVVEQARQARVAAEEVV